MKIFKSEEKVKNFWLNESHEITSNTQNKNKAEPENELEKFNNKWLKEDIDKYINKDFLVYIKKQEGELEEIIQYKGIRKNNKFIKMNVSKKYTIENMVINE